MSSKRSRVHPTYKTKYRAASGSAPDQGLIDRGDLAPWISQPPKTGCAGQPTQPAQSVPPNSNPMTAARRRSLSAAA